MSAEAGNSDRDGGRLCQRENGFFIPVVLLLLCQQYGERLCNIGFQTGGGLFQNPQIGHVCLARRHTPVKRLPGLAEDLLREKVVAMAVIAKTARVAWQTVDDVPVVD